jgi:DNA-binding CsgD family transcriptional regulator
MPAGPQMIIGREAELHRVEELLDAIEHGPTALVIEGEIGIGKTALWKQGLSAADRRAYQVLACRPNDAEAQLAYAAVGDLLAEVPEEVLAELPGPQRRALEVALLRAEPEEGQSLPRAVPLGLLGVLRTLGRRWPTVVGIDDVQWLDHPSERALAFVARRLTDERVGLLVTRRLEGAPETPLELERGLPDGRLDRLRVGSLTVAELDRLLSARLGTPFPRQTLARLHRSSGGNPFFALEIAGAILRNGDPSAPVEELPIPASLQGLVRDHLTMLAPPVREATQVAAALSRPTVALVDSATEGHAAVEAAVAAGVLELDDERLRFAHPLLGSVAYAQLPSAQKRTLHARLATIMDDPEERGRHLALAAEHADARVASALDEAARRARARGAPDAAAELWEQARQLTPANARQRARQRAVEAAECHFEAGDGERARVLLEEIVGESPSGRDRAHALARLGWVRAHQEGIRAAADVFRAALAENADDAALRIQIEEGLAWCLHSISGVRAAEGHARTALELAEALGEPALLAGALSYAAFLESLRGGGIALATIERAIDLGQAPGWSEILGRPDWIQALLLEWAGELDAARERLQVLRQTAVNRGEEHALPSILFQLARVELLTGDWERALRHGVECQETTLHSGQAGERPYALTIQALVDAHLGLVEPARAKIEEGLALARRLGVQPAEFELLAARGFLELSLADARQADRTFSELTPMVKTFGFGEPALFRFHGDAIEAKVALGDRREAQALLEELEGLGEALQRPWVLVVAGRCRGLLSAANGDLDTSYRVLEQALELHNRLGEPFERGRTMLALGGVQRRDRKKRAARASLESALEVFEELGAAVWASRARAELARVGGRASAAGLTPTEERIAELIAAGRTYREVANALFISPKTVQWNLSKIYRKLGIRSRAELAGRLAAERSPSGEDGDASLVERPVPG